jgi:hypothetical protein
MAIDGTTPVNFKAAVPAGFVAIVHRVDWHYMDAGVEPNLFAGISALTNGVQVGIYDSDDSVIQDVFTVKQNIEWQHFGSSILRLHQGATLDVFEAIWDLPEMTGFAALLTAGQYFRTRIQDNLSTLDHFDAHVHGRLIPL